VRLNRSSLRNVAARAGASVCAAVTLGVGTACGGAGAAAPTPTAVPATAAAAVAPSPQRPAFASPAPSPSAPASLPAAASTPTASTDAGSTEYEVASGDTLLSIADKTYGDQTQWRRIYDANKDTIGSDPDKLKIGMKLKIPPKQS
jgi:nucleoid-associated protein YgaU